MIRKFLYKSAPAAVLPNNGHELLTSITGVLEDHLAAARDREDQITTRLSALEAEQHAITQVKTMVGGLK